VTEAIREARTKALCWVPGTYNPNVHQTSAVTAGVQRWWKKQVGAFDLQASRPLRPCAVLDVSAFRVLVE